MRNIVEFITESKFAKAAKQCKTFGEFFYLYTGCNDISELTEEDYTSNDYGYLFNHEGSLKEFVNWFNTVKDNKITAVKPNDANATITFKMGKEAFDLDFIGD